MAKVTYPRHWKAKPGIKMVYGPSALASGQAAANKIVPKQPKGKATGTA